MQNKPAGDVCGVGQGTLQNVPQAMKNVLPALANEFIVLLKETSVAGYVAVKDLTFGGDSIRGVTYSAFMPLLVLFLAAACSLFQVCTALASSSAVG